MKEEEEEDQYSLVDLERPNVQLFFDEYQENLRKELFRIEGLSKGDTDLELCRLERVLRERGPVKLVHHVAMNEYLARYRAVWVGLQERERF